MGRKAIDLIGQIFGKLTVIERKESLKGQPYWLCHCECGTDKEIIGSNLRSGQSKSCGCGVADGIRKSFEQGRITTNIFIDITGKKFSRWTVLSRVTNAKSSKWLCRCDCGIEKIVPRSNLVGNRTKSCGCLQKEITSFQFTKHKLTDHPIYNTWASMKNRCSNPNQDDYQWYGGRGIKVCERWQDFQNFYTDMFSTWQEGLSIDRIDVNGDYEINNCRWVTWEIQCRNTRRSKFMETPWGSMNVSDACDKAGVDRNSTKDRIWRGWLEKGLLKINN